MKWGLEGDTLILKLSFFGGGEYEELAKLFFRLILWSGVAERSDDDALFYAD